MLRVRLDILQFRNFLHHSVIIHDEILLIFKLIFNFLLYRMLYLILFYLMQFHGVIHNFLDESASIEDLSMHVTKEQLHFVQFLCHFLDPIAKAEHLRIFFDQRVASFSCFFHHNLVFIQALQLINLVVFIVNLKHLIAN